jgi:hypothetical protein
MTAALCLQDNTLASFIAGHLVGDDLRLVVEHLDRCPECHAVVAGARSRSSAPGVAIKMLRGAARDGAEMSARFLREARALAPLVRSSHRLSSDRIEPIPASGPG